MSGIISRTVEFRASDQTDGFTIGELHEYLTRLLVDHRIDPASQLYAKIKLGRADKNGSKVFGVTIVGPESETVTITKDKNGA